MTVLAEKRLAEKKLAEKKLAEKLLAEALTLAEDEREALAEALWASLHGEPETLRLSPAWSAEVDDRIASLRRGEARTIPWDEVAARIRGPIADR